MGQNKLYFEEMGLYKGSSKGQLLWKKDEKYCESNESSSSSIGSDSSCISSSDGAGDVDDDASSSGPCGPLYELGELMLELPIKRGLSKYYNGKSQTFASLENIESLAKIEKTFPYSRRMKSSKSFGGCLNHQCKFGPKATITKSSKSPKRSFS